MICVAGFQRQFAFPILSWKSRLEKSRVTNRSFSRLNRPTGMLDSLFAVAGHLKRALFGSDSARRIRPSFLDAKSIIAIL